MLTPRQRAMLAAQEERYRQHQRERYTRATVQSGLLGQVRWSTHHPRSILGQLGGLDLPVKSIMVFVATTLLLSHGFLLLAALGVALSGSVWSIPATIPMVVVATYAVCLASAANMVRELVGLFSLFSRERGSLVAALFQGYFGALLTIGLLYLIHLYIQAAAWPLFWLPIFYLVPIDIYGFTVPIPLFMGFTGTYLVLVWWVVVFAVGVTGACTGGLALLRFLLEDLQGRGVYGALLSVLVVAVFPALNVWGAVTVLELVSQLLAWRLVGLG